MVESGFIHPFADPSIPPQCRVSARRTVGPQAVAEGVAGEKRMGCMLSMRLGEPGGGSVSTDGGGEGRLSKSRLQNDS